jgi:threonine dehydratase
MSQNYVQKIQDADIYDLAIETPIDNAPLLSQRLNNRVLLKREDLQPVFSFKLRGAYNKLLNLSEQQLATGCCGGLRWKSCSGSCLRRQRKWV